MRTVKPIAIEDILYGHMKQWIIEWKAAGDDGDDGDGQDRDDAGAADVPDGLREACAA